MLKYLTALTALSAALLLAVAATHAAPSPQGRAAPNPQVRVCTLLTPDEISAAVGAKPGASRENNVTIPEGPSQGDTMATCMWPLSGMDVVTISAVKALQGAQRQAALADLDNATNEMKSQGWREERQDIGGARCSTMTPPAAERTAPVMTGCFMETKGVALSVGTMTANKKTAIQPMRDLLDKASSRLP